MSHLWGLDSAYAPSAQAASKLLSEGWAFYGGYVGGHALHTWSKADFDVVASAGFKLMAFWVGPLSGDPGYDAGVNDGNACLVAMQQRGLTGWVTDDAESGIVRPLWSQGFVDALHAGTCSVRVYGTRATLQGMGGIYDSWHLAWYPTTLQGVASQQIIDWDIWQYSDGPVYDYNVAREDTPFTGYNA